MSYSFKQRVLLSNVSFNKRMTLQGGPKVSTYTNSNKSH